MHWQEARVPGMGVLRLIDWLTNYAVCRELHHKGRYVRPACTAAEAYECRNSTPSRKGHVMAVGVAFVGWDVYGVCCATRPKLG